MATLNPRITITVTPRVNAALDQFSSVTGKSKSAMVGEILDESVPMLTKMIKVMQAAKSMEKDMAAKVIAPFEDAHAHIEKQLGLTLEDFEGTTDDMLRQMEAIGRRARRAPGSPRVAGTGGTPKPAPLSNRGGKHKTGHVTKIPKRLISKVKIKK